MFKKTLLSLSCSIALGAVAAPALASSKFFLVVPLNAQAQAQEPVEAITVSLAGAALPKATVNQTYSESLRNYLSVTGDAAFDPAAASWSLADGTLPAGLALDATTGAVAGTPTTKTTSPASFTVLASYKGSDGQAVYTIEVGGVVLNVRELSAGQKHTCAITDVGGVKCWGDNTYGQLGDNSTVQRLTPVDVAGLGSEVASIAAGGYSTCAVTTSGSAKCWGRNNYGQLGINSTTTQSNTPEDVIGLGSGVASISVGEYHACAVITPGAAKCWGYNVQGQLGDNSKTRRLSPVDVVGLDFGVESISAGSNHTCVLMTSGAAKCWGYNYYGQLGDNSTTARLTPVAVVGLTSGVVNVEAGSYHTCAVMTSGVAKCWGLNTSGQLGDNSTAQRLTPVGVDGLDSGVATIAAGAQNTCVVTISGAAKCWGENGAGQLGNNSTTDRLVPVDVVGLGSGVSSISTGYNHTCATTTSGATKCWGQNSNGQLGDNSTTDRKTPVDVQDFQ
ncbi:putative Ig domain-containing protein [Limnobacter sp. CACIAM 66H1]|uniref:putative Ig domain-containing protein n=1 Tax=Limnobacter sp. CACIAM 66H1 TaxID=1813033 RepID=UPI000ACE9A57|nr:putative Ig domain-containing protein [Limnobacter sp. CACIAM 66H1]